MSAISAGVRVIASRAIRIDGNMAFVHAEFLVGVIASRTRSWRIHALSVDNASAGQHYPFIAQAIQHPGLMMGHTDQQVPCVSTARHLVHVNPVCASIPSLLFQAAIARSRTTFRPSHRWNSSSTCAPSSLRLPELARMHPNH